MAAATSTNNNLSKKLLIEVALLDYCRMANVSEADIDRLYQQVEKLNNEAFNDEKSLDMVVAHNLDSITSRDILKERISQLKSGLVEKIFSYYAVNDGATNINLIESVINSAGIDKKSSKALAQAICDKTLAEPYKKDQTWADRLAVVLFQNQKKLKEKLKENYQVYCQTGIKNPVIEQLNPDIKEYIGGVSHNLVLEYATRPAQKDFRTKLRANFSKPNGVRETFNKLVGLMAYNGMNVVKGEKVEANFNQFCETFKQYFGNDYLNELDKTLNIPSDIAENEKQIRRREQYQFKSQETYLKLMAGILSKKVAFDKNSYSPEADKSVYISTIENQFIKKLSRGQLDVRALCIEEPDYSVAAGSSKEEQALYKQSLDETAEKQVASIHHKLPLGSAYDVCDRLCAAMPESDKFAKSCQMVNNMSNMCLVIGKELHQRMEARGRYVMKANTDNCIFAAEASADILNLKMPSYLKEGLKKYVKPSSAKNSKNQLLTIAMNFSEPSELNQQRCKLAPEKSEVTIDKKYARYI